MHILLTGGAGFIGSRLRDSLLAAGHRVTCAGRGTVDFASATADDWLPALQGVDAVVNLVGILRNRGTQRLDVLHTRAPIAMFDACVRAGVRRVVQVSALGADEAAQTEYHRSKRAADEHLLALPLSAAVVQPSLVFGPGGASSAMFLEMAAMPLTVLPAGGRQVVQPVHVDDLVALLHRLVEDDTVRGRVAAVGPRASTLAQYLADLRAGMGLKPAPRIAVPAFAMALAARAGDFLPWMTLDRSAWQMLQRGNAADARDTTALLGRAPRAPAEFIARTERDMVRTQAQLGALLPLLRSALALLWIATAIVSFGVYPVEQSYQLLAQAGVPEPLRPAALYGAALLDLLLGLACLLPWKRRHLVWAAQIALILAYSVIIAFRLPEWWLHPYGPMTKNIPILALLALLWTLERR